MLKTSNNLIIKIIVKLKTANIIWTIQIIEKHTK